MTRHFKTPTQPLGDKLAPKIALLVKQVMHDHLRESGAHRAKIGAQAGVEFWKTVTAERDIHWAPMLDRLLVHEKHPEWLAKANQFLRTGQGEGAAMAAVSVAQGAASQTIMQVLNAELAPAIHYELSRLGTFLLDPATSASLAAHGIITAEQAASEAGGSGYNAWRTERLIEANETYPDLASALELYRRGKTNRQQFTHWMRRGGIPEDVATIMLELWEVPLSPEELALQVLKGIRTEQEVLAEAHESGVNSERLARLVLATGEPIGLEQMLEAYRRGFMNRERLEHGVKQSRVRNEWMDVIEKLRYEPASASDAFRGVVQGHITEAEGRRITQQQGLEPSEFDWLLKTAGNPPGMMQMISLWRRGDASQAQVEQAMRESHLKNKYIPALLHLKRTIPPLFQILHAVEHGGLAEHEAAKLLTELGYDQTVVGAMVHAALTKGAGKVKELTASEVQTLYYDHAIGEAEALKTLQAIGYSRHNAQLILSLQDLRRERALEQAAMSPIRTEYIARRIEESEAKTKLDGLGLPAQQTALALKLWKVDREAHTKLLTEAQIVKANTMGLLTDGEAEGRLMALGYHHSDAKLLLDMEKGRTHGAP